MMMVTKERLREREERTRTQTGQETQRLTGNRWLASSTRYDPLSAAAAAGEQSVVLYYYLQLQPLPRLLLSSSFSTDPPAGNLTGMALSLLPGSAAAEVADVTRLHAALQSQLFASLPRSLPPASHSLSRFLAHLAAGDVSVLLPAVSPSFACSLPLPLCYRRQLHSALAC
jgi:hypothetical protein